MTVTSTNRKGVPLPLRLHLRRLRPLFPALFLFALPSSPLLASWAGLPPAFYADDPFIQTARELPGHAAVYTVIENGRRAIELDLLTRTDPADITDLYRHLARRLGTSFREQTARVEPFGTLISAHLNGHDKRLYLVPGPKNQPVHIRLTSFTDCPRLARAFPSVLDDFPELLRHEGRLLLHREILHPQGRSASLTYETSQRARDALQLIARDLTRLGWTSLEGRGGLTADGTCLEGRMATYQKGPTTLVLFCGTPAGRASPNTLSLLLQDQPTSH